MPARAMPWALALAAVLIGCDGREPAAERPTDGAADTAAALRRPDAERSVVARDAWNTAEVVRRLTEAGLVVQDSTQLVERDGIDRPGTLLTVSGSRLELYVFPSTAARERVSAVIDTATPALPTPDRPRYIFSGNLIAVHIAPRERLAERVQNVLLARHLR